jgi:saccharopine dehydrogenase (NAD+, L-lysine-forming)
MFIMKISVIGAGAQGSAICFLLAKEAEVSKIVCADIDLDRAKRVMEKLGSDSVSTQQVDAGNVDDLVSVIEGSDVVINATLPRFNVNIMKAALKSGVHYQDFASESLPEEFELDDKFKNAGLTAVINNGGPFVINALVRYAADKLDAVDEIHLRQGYKHVGKTDVVPKWTPQWCPEVALTEWTESPPIYENGELKRVPPFSGMEEYPFPEPVGPATICYVDYEPVYTLPRFIKGVKHVSFKTAPDIMAGSLAKMGFASDEPIEVKGVKVAPIDVLLSLVPPPSESDIAEKVKAGEINVFWCFLAEVKGKDAGEEVTYIYYWNTNLKEDIEKYDLPHQVEDNIPVALPGVVMAMMLARGEIKTKGVLPIEGLEPEPFIAKLVEKGVIFHERLTRELHV